MRVFFFLGLSALSLSFAACSGGTEDTTLRRTPSSREGSQTPGGTTLPNETKSDSTSPPPADPPADPSPPASDAGAPSPTPPAAGSCGAPKCFGLGGFGGCKATDAAGQLVTMACQNGECLCLGGAQNTTTFAGDVASADDARQLFFTNCNCN